jgi:cellulose synthase/poly-beta-1,6-N-acetylglucosamine synthase-like glycosyltransferase
MLLIFAAALAVQVACWVWISAGFKRARADEPPSSPLPVSVVVAARNEEAALPALLDALAAQTHPDFEVVVVDDASEDGTAALVEAQAARDDRFRLVRVAEPVAPRKKHALTRGIAAASHDRLAFTDADCTPPPDWLAGLAAHAGAEPDAPGPGPGRAVLVGYGPYRKEPGLLNAFVRYETAVTALLAAAAVGWGRPYMAVGRNFSYPKSLFDRLGGFAHSLASLSGDDDLLVQEVARHEAAPVRFVFDPDTFVPSEAPPTWRAWARQKQRHTSAGAHYDRGVQLALAVFHGSNLLVWVAPVVLGWTGTALLAGRFLFQRAVLREAMEAFEGGRPLTRPAVPRRLYLLYNTLLAPLGAVWRPKRW